MTDPSLPNHDELVSLLTKLSDLKHGMTIAWLDGTRHSSWLKAFDVADGFPQALSLQRKQRRYRHYRSGI